MGLKRVSFRGKKFVFLIFSIVLMGCQTTVPNIAPDSIAAINILKDHLDKQKKQINELEERISSYEILMIKHSDIIDSLSIKEDARDRLKINLDGFQNTSIEKDFIIVLDKLQKKIQVLEDRSLYTDSLYFTIIKDIVQFEKKISSFIISVEEIDDISKNEAPFKLPKISLEEYNKKYIDALASFQNSEWESSLAGFNYLIKIDSDHDLADNSQYWIGEIYYAIKDYNRSIKEFEKVSSFINSNKLDDAQYKIGLCYTNLGEKNIARKKFSNFLQYFPNSEYSEKVRSYIQ